MTHDLFDSTAREPDVPRRVMTRSGGNWRLDVPAEQAYTVSAVNALAREILEGTLPPLWIRGEVAGWKRHGSGHCYFTLRDAAAQIRCVMFRSDAQRLPTDPADGMEVYTLGTLTLYEKRGEYQFVVRELEGVGAGGLWRLAFDRLHARLEKEGLLAAERKRPLPRFPGVVGVVTSPVGAALHDILHVIERRAPWTRVVFAATRVQGEGAGQDIARAIRLVERSGLADVVIVGRGGGATEDLWAFNEEAVARAIAGCPVPVISAVGHEVDVTIADLVADARAPTPSAAAERAVPDGAALARELAALAVRSESAVTRRVDARLRNVAAADEALRAGLRNRLRRWQDRLAGLSDRLDALSPLAALRRGYAVPRDERGRVLRRAEQFAPGQAVHLRITDGVVDCHVDAVHREEAGDAGGG